MNSDSHKSVTVDALLELARSMPQMPKREFERIIVGAPLIPEGTAYEDTERKVIWMHRKDFDTIPKAEHPEDLGIVRLMGVPVEMFTWEWHEVI